jgi:hypothetical protein
MNNAEHHRSDNIYQACFINLVGRLFHHVATTIVRSSSVNNVVGTMLFTIVA